MPECLYCLCKPRTYNPAGSLKMRRPTALGAFIVWIYVHQRLDHDLPTSAGSFRVQQGRIQREVALVIRRHGGVWRNVLKHKKVILISI